MTIFLLWVTLNERVEYSWDTKNRDFSPMVARRYIVTTEQWQKALRELSKRVIADVLEQSQRVTDYSQWLK